MNKLDIDNKGNIVIFNAEKDSDVSFLLEDFFDNSLDKLKEDIEICQDTLKKNLLIQFAEKYENGELDFISDYWQNDESEDPANSSVEFGLNRDGMSQFIANNVIAIHSGFWYAADNIDKELENINRYKHNYEGFVIASERIETVISILKDAPDLKSTTRGIQTLGLTRAQSEAVVSSRLDMLTSYDTKYLQNRIACCEKLGVVLKEIHTLNGNERGIAFYAAQLRKSPMFQLSLSSKELFHSNFLYWIFNIELVGPRIFKDIITDLYAQSDGGSDKLNEWPDNFKVKREYNNHDLCVLDNQDKIWLVIENKVKSIPSLSQLERYFDETKSAHHLLLSLSTHFPARDEIKDIHKEGLGWVIANYKSLSSILKKYISCEDIGLDAYRTAIINDYSDFIAILDKIQESWSIKPNQVCQDFFDTKDTVELEDLRIKDLKEKHRFSSICTILYNQLNKCAEWGSGRNTIFSIDQKPNQRQVFLGWGMTRTQGLLEAKILIAKDIALVIQIQGSQYRHCIELGDNIKEKIWKTHENWISDSVYAPAAWFFRTSDDSSQPFMQFNGSHEALDIKPNRKNNVLGYNKFNDDFFYQSITIPKSVKIKDVLDMVEYDCLRIFNHFAATE